MFQLLKIKNTYMKKSKEMKDSKTSVTQILESRI